ncbi:hypothetical protein SAMN05216198_2413 [Halopseudomonas litoralis]|uniref:Uncharacterized protein n=1 Tax=Halopseudomonas litoralis TaxID=797277 RepID=A0A1H1TWE8_9GAMM|nr:hypothetical protein [Halopseudomonas litoralis]SDS64236.1 hypothetical protein SAMN05216198_2413 [Halopseudomonas litoralis]
MAVFEVVFHGQVRADVAPEQARARIGQLFQVADRQLDMLFSGRRIVIKQGLDQAAAEKYRQAIERAGALCEVLPVADSPAEAAPQPVPRVTQPAQQSAAPVPRDEFMAAFSDVEAPDLPIAPLGSDMQDAYADHTPLSLDLSAFSLAPPGSDLAQLKTSVPLVTPDITHLHMLDED